MTGQEQELPVVRKLLRKPEVASRPTISELEAILAAPQTEAVTINPDGSIGTGYINPDGPEAAELITELVEAGEPLAEEYGRQACDDWFDDDLVEIRVRDLRKLIDVLTKARASTGGGE